MVLVAARMATGDGVNSRNSGFHLNGEFNHLAFKRLSVFDSAAVAPIYGIVLMSICSHCSGVVHFISSPIILTIIQLLQITGV